MKTVHELLTEARAALPHRPSPSEAVRAQRTGALLIDIRSDDQRRHDGLIPGALVIPRNSLEWRCDPGSAWRHPSIHDYDQQLVLICDQGFQSSLAAANLQQLGLRRATDMDGGFVAYRAEGLPVASSHAPPRGKKSNAAARHWDAIYEARAPEQVSWYQARPETSLELVDALAVRHDAAVIDVGGGASFLAESLLQRGFSDVSVLDVSERALRHLTDRHGSAERRLHVIRHDLLSWTPQRRYDLWHDRAVLHFFQDPVERSRYVEVLDAALAPSATAIIGVFALDGPHQCSGLPVMRYGARQLAELLGDGFRLVDERREEHRTPGGALQPFIWAAFTRRNQNILPA